jgi:hypothetical protein
VGVPARVHYVIISIVLKCRNPQGSMDHACVHRHPIFRFFYRTVFSFLDMNR